MKSSVFGHILLYAGCALGVATVFHRGLGLPDYFQRVFVVPAWVCLFFGAWLVRRVSRETTGSAPPMRSKRFLIKAAAGFVVALILAPLLLPYTGYHVHPSLRQYVFSSVVTFVVFAPLSFLAWKAEGWQRTARSRFDSIMMIMAVICALASVYFAFSSR